MRTMLVHGAIVPPHSAREAVAAVVRAVPVSVEAGAAQQAGKGLRGRLGRHRADKAEAQPGEPEVLSHVPVERMVLPITAFGNLTTHDANRMVEAITAEASGWVPSTVRLAGGTALDFPGDWSVWSRLAGDVDALSAAARGVTHCVERLGFFVDRRQFRPMLSVATVTPATTGPYLQQVVDALEAFEGEEWDVAISLTTETFVEGKAETVEFARISLAT